MHPQEDQNNRNHIWSGQSTFCYPSICDWTRESKKKKVNTQQSISHLTSQRAFCNNYTHVTPVFSSPREKSPMEWKMAHVTAIFKKRRKYDASNYRPNSLTSSVCKILEHIIFSEVKLHIEAHIILSDKQQLNTTLFKLRISHHP